MTDIRPVDGASFYYSVMGRCYYDIHRECVEGDCCLPLPANDHPAAYPPQQPRWQREKEHPMSDQQTAWTPGCDTRSWAERNGYCIEETRYCECAECEAYRAHGAGRPWQGVTRDERRIANDIHDTSDGVGDMRRAISARGKARRELRALAPEMAAAILEHFPPTADDGRARIHFPVMEALGERLRRIGGDR